MALPRSRYVQDGKEGVYHCYTRCVRRAFLCGFDSQTGRDFSHRRQWMLKRLQQLATIFSIEVCAYALMATHYHLILWLRPDLVASWSDEEVAIRWLKLFPKGSGGPTEEEIQALLAIPGRIAELRDRLCSISWFMASLNEYIARRANREDNVKGRFWESRFKCTALLDTAAIATCMSYVDLNAIRSRLANTPEESDFTSIQERIRAWREETKPSPCTSVAGQETGNSSSSNNWLCPIESDGSRRGILPLTTAEYFELVDRSGRMVRSDKPGAIDASLLPILVRIRANPDNWQDTVSLFNSRFRLAAGLVSSLRAFSNRLGRHWVHGISAARAAFGPLTPESA